VEMYSLCRSNSLSIASYVFVLVLYLFSAAKIRVFSKIQIKIKNVFFKIHNLFKYVFYKIQK